MNLSVVILTYNSAAYLKSCLESIRQSSPAGAPEIIVVNNSFGDRAAVRRVCSSLGADRLIENRRNLGVAHGRNQGVRASSRAAVCTLDVDTIVTGTALEILRSRVAGDPTLGVCGPQLRYSDGMVQMSCRQFPTIATKCLRLAPSLDFTGALAAEEMRAADHSRRMTVDWVIGACQCYRREVYDDADGYRTYSRFGAEDIDFCLRVWLRGLSVQYEPAAVIIHHEQRIARSPWRLLTAAHLLSLIKYFGEHRYGLSREGLYRRIRDAKIAFGARESGLSGAPAAR